MKSNHLRILPLFLSLFLGGCATVDLKTPRADDYSEANKEKIRGIAALRSKTLADNETYFTDRLRCIGKGKLINDLALRISVAPIYDKTAKVFPTGSTAISDMTVNALSYVKGLRIVDTPFNGDITESRVNLLSDKYVYLGKGLKDNIVPISNKIAPVPFGILFPSQLSIAGALVQYDEGTETISPEIGLDIDAFSGKRSVETISIGLHLRLVNSSDGEILTNSALGKRGSVLLSNKVYKIKTNANYFRLISAKQYGLDVSVTVDDPKHYVVQEMIERGVAELLSVLPNDAVCPENQEAQDVAENSAKTGQAESSPDLNNSEETGR